MQLEDDHVHAVYEAIAPHFSATRYKPWPRVDQFMRSMPKGSLGCDIGCGNGKYTAAYPHVFVIGNDRSSGLLKFASEKSEGHSADAFRCDALSVPVRPVFDFAISIAVVHHFSTTERRIEAVNEILSTLKQGGQALIYVWALEQGSSRRGWTEQDDQDVMVSWRSNTDPTNEKLRYYHLYRKGELAENIVAAGGKLLEEGYEKDNWWAVCTRDA